MGKIWGNMGVKIPHISPIFSPYFPHILPLPIMGGQVCLGGGGGGGGGVGPATPLFYSREQFS